MDIFLRGMAVGFAYLAPIGLQNLFVIHSALTHRFARAMAVAAIVIFFDISLSLASFFGAGAFLEAFPAVSKAVLLIGGHVLMLMGFRLVRAKAADMGEGRAEASLWKSAATAFVVTWVNPQAVIDAALLIGASRAALPASSDAVFMSGLVLASCLWFPCLTALVSLAGSRFSPRVLRGINMACGAVLFLYGASLCFKAAEMMF